MSDIKQAIFDEINGLEPVPQHSARESRIDRLAIHRAMRIMDRHLEGMVIMPENLTPEIISDIKHSYGDFTDLYCESDIIDNHRLAVMTFKESK